MTIDYQQDGDTTTVCLSGEIDETASLIFPQIKDHVKQNVRFNFKNVDNINSSGVRAWISFFRPFAKEFPVVFEEVPPNIVIQLNMIPSFYEGHPVESVYGNFVCDYCGHQKLQRFDHSGDGMPDIDTEIEDIPCDNCGKMMEFEEDDSFFAFNTDFD